MLARMFALLDLLWPSACVACGAAGPVACPGCLRSLQQPPRLAWPDPAPAGLPPPYAVATYVGAVRTFLLAYKEDGVSSLRRSLAGGLARALMAAASAYDGPIVVVPAPSTADSRRRRGDDVVLALTRAAARTADPGRGRLRVVAALRHSRRVADSAGLSAAARAENLAGAFAVTPRARRALDGAAVVVADDLITTGATILEATRALAGAGGHVVAAASIAATRRAATGTDGSAQP